MAGLAIAFLLLTIVVQLGAALTARNAASAATDASARRAALSNAPLPGEAAALEGAVANTVPGAADINASVIIEDSMAIATVTFTWQPPGPVLRTFSMTTEARQAVVIPP